MDLIDAMGYLSHLPQCGDVAQRLHDIFVAAKEGKYYFISRSGVMRGHGKTPPFRTGMKCLSHRHVLNISTKEEKNENKIN
jgi:hypothetical protein